MSSTRAESLVGLGSDKKKRQRDDDLDDFDPDLDISRYSITFLCSFPFYRVDLLLYLLIILDFLSDFASISLE
jgi:hypothetical protein